MRCSSRPRRVGYLDRGAPALESEFRVTIRPADPTVLVLSGELDLASYPRLEHAIDRVLESTPTSELVVLDLSGLEFMDIAGLRSVLRSDQRLRGVGKRFVVASPAPGVRRLLALTDQERALRVFGSLDEAVERGSSDPQ